MSSAKNGSKKSAKRPSRKRKGTGTHVIDYQPESPVIREHEAVERRRRGFRTAMWLITAMIVVGIGWVTWHEALEKNAQFMLKTVEVNAALVRPGAGWYCPRPLPSHFYKCGHCCFSEVGPRSDPGGGVSNGALSPSGYGGFFSGGAIVDFVPSSSFIGG